MTYNTFGREFIDRGMNEAGLHVGEMTVRGTVWPSDVRPTIYHHHHYDHQRMQYLLDNFATVDEALTSLQEVCPSRHCQWHIFPANRLGRAVVVEP